MSLRWESTAVSYYTDFCKGVGSVMALRAKPQRSQDKLTNNAAPLRVALFLVLADSPVKGLISNEGCPPHCYLSLEDFYI